MNRDKIENVDFDQSRLGRIFGYWHGHRARHRR
jgi:hypothetical protein